jgi:hypothetical protein
MTWRAKLSTGCLAWLAFAAFIAALDVLLLRRLLTHDIALQQINWLTFLTGLLVLASLPPLAIAVYHTLVCLTLRYRLYRNGLVIHWVGSTQVIPIRDIQRIVRGSELPGPVVVRRGLRWPGYEGREGAVPGIGRTRFLSTGPLHQQLLLVTPGVAVAISPSNPEGFLEAFTSRQALGPNRLLDPELRFARWLGWDLWTNHTAWLLLGTAAVINLALFCYLCVRFPGLDIQLPLHFNSLGQADRIAPKAELFALPIIGLIVIGTNLLLGVLLYRRERAGSYLLWGAAAAAQALFWLATFSILA